MRIGELATASGVGVQALRYYERRGLLRPDSRDASGHRVYAPSAAKRARFIKRAVELGLGLVDVDEILQLHDGAVAKAEVQVRALEHAHQIKRRIQSLEVIEQALMTLVETLRRDVEPSCPLFDDEGPLADDEGDRQH